MATTGKLKIFYPLWVRIPPNLPMTLYGLQNEAGKYLLVIAGKGYFFTPTIPHRQLLDNKKQANQVAVRLSKKRPELKGRLTIVPVVLTCEDSLEVEYPPEKEEE